MVVLSTPNSNDVLSWCSDSAGIEHILVSTCAEWLLPSQVILRQWGISNFESQDIHLISQLSCHLHLIKSVLVFDLYVIADIDWKWLSKIKILILIPPSCEPAWFDWFNLISLFESLLKLLSDASRSTKLFNLLFNDLVFRFILAKRLCWPPATYLD